MSKLYPNQCHNEVCYKGTALYEVNNNADYYSNAKKKKKQFYMDIIHMIVCLIDLILYIPVNKSTIFQFYQLPLI